MAHWFVSQARDAFPRWRKAFPDALTASVAQVQREATAGDHVWVMNDVRNWEQWVNDFYQRGAIVIVLSLAPAGNEALHALEAGARGYAHALSPAERFQQAALVTANQGIWVPPELLGRVIGATFRALGGESRLPEEDLRALTERERAVAIAVATGHSNKAVARQLDITERTVKAHLGAVFRKLGVRDRMQLVLRLSRQAETS